MAVAQQIKGIVDRVRSECEKVGTGEDALPEGFLEPLLDLERYDLKRPPASMTLKRCRCIAKSLETLNTCKTGSNRLRDRARVYLNRSDLSGDVKKCLVEMQSALDLFNVRIISPSLYTSNLPRV